MKSEVMNLNFKNGVGFLTYKIYDNIDFVNHAISTEIRQRSEHWTMESDLMNPPLLE